MKKILIASSCAIMLCFTSCASKQAPEADSQIEAPETDNTEATEASQADENTEADNDGVGQKAAEETETSKAEETEADKPLTSEDFPEPESIDEPEIITLEPIEEVETAENEPASEEVKLEEPPEITPSNSNEENAEEKQTETETAQNENEGLSPDENDVEDITANDVIIVSNQDSDGISGGIDITDDDSDSDVNLSDLEKNITPSRSVTLKKFEYLDVTYPGSGWIYMGLTDNSKDLAYFGRKLGTKDTKFSLQARASGTKIIHFYRNDPLTGQYLDDYVEVIITAENGSNKTHVEAPEYKLPLQKKEKPVKKVEEASEEITEEKENTSTSVSAPTTTAAPAAPVKSATGTAAKSAATSTAKAPATTTTSPAKDAPVSEPAKAENPDPAANTANASNPDSLLKEAQVLYNEKEYSVALNKLNQFFEYSTDNRDQALYLKGQILEAKSDVRDIKGAIDAYTTLTKNYPASKLWDSANKRIIYLKRFYLEVR